MLFSCKYSKFRANLKKLSELSNEGTLNNDLLENKPIIQERGDEALYLMLTMGIKRKKQVGNVKEEATECDKYFNISQQRESYGVLR